MMLEVFKNYFSLEETGGSIVDTIQILMLNLFPHMSDCIVLFDPIALSINVMITCKSFWIIIQIK
jgi:hypothetical protein